MQQLRLSEIRDAHNGRFNARAEVDGRVMTVDFCGEMVASVVYDESELRGDATTDNIRLSWTYRELEEALFVEYGVEADLPIWQDVTE